MKQKNVVIAGIQNIWNPLTTCYLGCVVTDWDGIQKKHKYYRQKFLSNAYFCIQNMDCLQKIVPGVKHKHLYMGNYYFQSLTHEHMDLLKQYGYWDNIINNRKQLIDDATSKHTGNGNQE